MNHNTMQHTLLHCLPLCVLFLALERPRPARPSTDPSPPASMFLKACRAVHPSLPTSHFPSASFSCGWRDDRSCTVTLLRTHSQTDLQVDQHALLPSLVHLQQSVAELSQHCQEVQVGGRGSICCRLTIRTGQGKLNAFPEGKGDMK